MTSPIKPVVVAIVLFVIAAAIRLSLNGTARFGGDEALFFRIGMDIVEGNGFPLLGTQITDGAAKLPGPAFLYLMALPLLVWRAPEAQYAFVEVLGALAVVVWWATVRRPFGERAAFVAGLFGACSPWAVLYADRTWNPNVLPLFVGVALWCAWRLRDNAHSRAAMLLWPTLALLPQLHMSTPTAIVGVIVVAWPALREARHAKRAHLIGLAAALLLYVPLAIHEVQSGMDNTRLVLREVFGVGAVSTSTEKHPWGFLWVPIYTLRLLSLDVTYHELTGYWGGPDEWACLRALFTGSVARPFHVLRAVALAVSVVFSLGVWFVAWRAKSAAARVAVVSAIVVVVVNTLLMGVASKQVFGHYVICQLPFLVVLVAAAASQTSARIAGAMCAIMCIGGVEAAVSVNRNVDAKIGLVVHRRAAAIIIDDARQAEIQSSAPISLSFVGLRSSHYDWHVFGTRALHEPWHFTSSAQKRRYALTPIGAAAPRDAIGDAIDVGHAWLWRRR